MENYEKIWDLLDKYSFKLDPQISPFVTCCVCENLLLNASQGPCGCMYCIDCIEKYLEDGPKSCPGDTKECGQKSLTMETIIKTDNSANRRISKLQVKCPIAFCNFQGEMNEMVEHVPNCEKKQAQIMELNKEIGDVKIKYNELLIMIKSTQEQTERQHSQLKEHLEDSLKKLRQEINKHKDYDERRDRKIMELERQIRELKERPIIETPITPPVKEISVKHVWDIEKFSRIKKKGAVVWSELFYSINQEYLMRLWLHPNGSAVGTAHHMSIEFCICDDADNTLLKWPIKCHINIVLKSKDYPETPDKSLSRSCVISKALFPQFSSEYFHFIYSDPDIIALLQSKTLTVECEAEIGH